MNKVYKKGSVLLSLCRSFVRSIYNTPKIKSTRVELNLHIVAGATARKANKKMPASCSGHPIARHSVFLVIYTVPRSYSPRLWRITIAFRCHVMKPFMLTLISSDRRNNASVTSIYSWRDHIFEWNKGLKCRNKSSKSTKRETMFILYNVAFPHSLIRTLAIANIGIKQH